MAERRIRLSNVTGKIAARLLYLYMRFVWLTSRMTVVNADLRNGEIANPSGGIIGAWHGRLMLSLVEGLHGMRPAIIASKSRDGQFALDIIAPFGLSAIRGSSKRNGKDKGGTEALQGAIDWLNADPEAYIAITPDGPRGPRGRCKHGIATIAATAQKWVIPLGYSTSFGIEFKSWDRFLIPLPFGHYAIVWGDPVRPPAKVTSASIEAYRLEIQSGMQAAQARADEITKRKVPFEAAPA